MKASRILQTSLMQSPLDGTSGQSACSWVQAFLSLSSPARLSSELNHPKVSAACFSWIAFF
jgi:hypothetical protein